MEKLKEEKQNKIVFTSEETCRATVREINFEAYDREMRIYNMKE